MGTKEDESSTGRVWAAEFHHVTAHSRLVHVFKLMNYLFLLIFQIFLGGRGQPRITETTDTESADTVVHLYILKMSECETTVSSAQLT